MRNMQFVNTRPASRAAFLSANIQQAGYQVVDVPLLELSALPVSPELESQYSALEDADCIVVVSITAAEIGIRQYLSLGYSLEHLKNKIWVAVGTATQQYLASFDITSLVPEAETSEGMLSLPVFKTYRNMTVAFWRGIGGRTFMMQQLKEQGCTVINMLLYKRHLPEQSWHLARNVLPYSAVLITSEQSWQHWQKLAMHYQWQLQHYYYIVLGQRVTQLMDDYFSEHKQNAYLIQVDYLSVPDIQTALKKVLSSL